MPNAVIKSHLPYPNAFMWYNDVATPAFVCITGMIFFCRGRHRNGENYLFDIKDISDGGCALIAKSPNLKFLTHSSILKNSVLSLAEYGEITIDLAIKNVVEVTLDEDSESYHQVSCQFKFRHREDKTRIEKMLLDLILEAKRKKRV